MYIHTLSHTLPYNIPCIACIIKPNILERNNVGMELASARDPYESSEERKATSKANLAPNKSPNRPNMGPPSNMATANTVSI